MLTQIVCSSPSRWVGVMGRWAGLYTHEQTVVVGGEKKEENKKESNAGRQADSCGGDSS